jgi:ATP-dependent RNA helicase SUPV3L1/SUV3
LLVFLPELNKPAAVRLRALLLTLWQEKSLPVEVPADGIVSFSVQDLIKEGEIDKDYYRSIGYPIYGPRSIRVDMLDRVICAVYDSADKGVFQAQHKMAEWLGSNIADLYAVLEAMGHVKIKDPADEKIAEAEVIKTESVVEGEVSVAEEVGNKEPVKPELATFKLKRGKAINTNRPIYVARDKKAENTKPKYKKKAVPKKNFKKEPRERVYVAEAKSDPADNPFAILGQLKTGNKE